VTKGRWNLYQVETGRRDGRVSRAKDAVKHLPDSFDGIRKLANRSSKGLDFKDLADDLYKFFFPYKFLDHKIFRLS
jgi:peroxidase